VAPNKTQFTLKEIELAFKSKNKTLIKHIITTFPEDDLKLEHDILSIAASIDLQTFFCNNISRLTYLLKQYPAAIHCKNAENETLIFNKKFNAHHSDVLILLIASGADPYLPNAKGVSLYSELQVDRRKNYLAIQLIEIEMLLQKIKFLKYSFPHDLTLTAMIMSYLDEDYRLWLQNQDGKDQTNKQFQTLMEALLENPDDSALSRKVVRLSYQLRSATQAIYILSEIIHIYSRDNLYYRKIIEPTVYVQFQKLLVAALKIADMLRKNTVAFMLVNDVRSSTYTSAEIITSSVSRLISSVRCPWSSKIIKELDNVPSDKKRRVDLRSVATCPPNKSF
jgi:hypothetical protein